jgi:hypothetical protein
VADGSLDFFLPKLLLPTDDAKLLPSTQFLPEPEIVLKKLLTNIPLRHIVRTPNNMFPEHAQNKHHKF